MLRNELVWQRIYLHWRMLRKWSWYIYIYMYIYIYIYSSIYTCIYIKLNYHDRKIRQALRATNRNTGQLFRPYYVSSAVYTMNSSGGDRTSDHRMQSRNYHWVTGQHRTQALLNQLVMVNTRTLYLLWVVVPSVLIEGTRFTPWSTSS